jgi:hypothetical protein
MVRSATTQRLTKVQQTRNMGVHFSRCKKLVRVIILATINICYRRLLCDCLFKNRQSRTSVKFSGLYGVIFLKVETLHRSETLVGFLQTA